MNNRRDRAISKVMVITPVASTVLAFLTEQIDALIEQGSDVAIVCSPDERMQMLRERGYRCIPLEIPRSSNPLKAFRATLKLITLLRRERPDLLHTHVPMAAFVGQLAGRLTGVKARFNTVHGLYFVAEDRAILRALFRHLEVMACRWATRVICVSAEDAELLRAEWLESGKIDTLNVGVNLDRFDPSEAMQQRTQVRDELQIPADAVVFGTVARLVREKGLVELFTAFNYMAGRRANVYLLHVGPEDQTRADAVSMELLERIVGKDRCRFVGQRYDVPRYLAAMDVFCLPSYREGFPVSIMEAGAMKLPCIVSDVRGCREAIVHGVTGLIVPPRNVEALRAAMLTLLDSVEERQTMGTSAHAAAIERFDRRSVVEQSLRMYAEAVNV